MIRLAKYLKPYRAMILLSIALLFAQANFDLALPDLLSDIVNVGIQQGGVENAVPEAIRASQMDKLLLFMSAEEQTAVLAAYTLIQQDSPDYASASEDYPALDGEGAADLPWSEVRGATLSGGFRQGRDFGLVLRFQFKDPVLAALNRGTVDRMLRSMLPDGKLDYTLETSVEQDWIRADVELVDIIAGLGSFLELPPGAPRFKVSDRDERRTE